MTHRCAICKHPTGGCYGYRWPGPRSKLPVAKRGYLWACAECRTQAEARWRAATGQRPHKPTLDTHKPTDAQGSLL